MNFLVLCFSPFCPRSLEQNEHKQFLKGHFTRPNIKHHQAKRHKKQNQSTNLARFGQHLSPPPFRGLANSFRQGKNVFFFHTKTPQKMAEHASLKLRGFGKAKAGKAKAPIDDVNRQGLFANEIPPEAKASLGVKANS